jgi:hypothetical protein
MEPHDGSDAHRVHVLARTRVQQNVLPNPPRCSQSRQQRTPGSAETQARRGHNRTAAPTKAPERLVPTQSCVSAAADAIAVLFHGRAVALTTYGLARAWVRCCCVGRAEASVGRARTDDTAGGNGISHDEPIMDLVPIRVSARALETVGESGEKRQTGMGMGGYGLRSAGANRLLQRKEYPPTNTSA